MRELMRNRSSFWYCLRDGINEITDEDGYFTSEYRETYSPPVKMSAIIAPATGEAVRRAFGISEEYDRLITTSDASCPINEETVLFIDKAPEFSEDGSPLYDYTVARVSRGISGIVYAAKKESVS